MTFFLNRHTARHTGPGRRTATALALALAFTPLLLTSCLTGFLPGENRKILQNLAEEYYTVATAYAEAKKYEKALEYYRLAMRDRDYHDPAYYQCARISVFLGRWEDARKMYQVLLAKDPANKDLLASLAYIEGMSGNLARSEALYREALAAHDYDAALRENLIRVLAAQEKTQEAEAEYAVYQESFPLAAAAMSLEDLLKVSKDQPEAEEEEPEAEAESEAEAEEPADQ